MDAETHLNEQAKTNHPYMEIYQRYYNLYTETAPSNNIMSICHVMKLKWNLLLVIFRDNILFTWKDGLDYYDKPTSSHYSE